jgi:hypothetical protein
MHRVLSPEIFRRQPLAVLDSHRRIVSTGQGLQCAVQHSRLVCFISKIVAFTTPLFWILTVGGTSSFLYGPRQQQRWARVSNSDVFVGQLPALCKTALGGEIVC